MLDTNSGYSIECNTQTQAIAYNVRHTNSGYNIQCKTQTHAIA